MCAETVIVKSQIIVIGKIGQMCFDGLQLGREIFARTQGEYHYNFYIRVCFFVKKLHINREEYR